MNPHKTEEDHLFNPHDLDPQAHIMDPTHLHTQSSPSSSFSLPPISEIVLFRDDDENDDSPMSHSESDPENDGGGGGGGAADKQAHLAPAYISPEPHISNQFYTFNSESHALMIRCILEGRLASPDEIRAATPRAVLKSWRAVWKDRNEDTAYLTAWKRIQDKLTARVDAATGLVDRFVGKMPLYAYSFSITSQCQFILQMKLQLESTMDVVIQQYLLEVLKWIQAQLTSLSPTPMCTHTRSWAEFHQAVSRLRKGNLLHMMSKAKLTSKRCTYGEDLLACLSR